MIQSDIFDHPSRLNAVCARAVDGSKNKIQWYHKNYLDHVYAISDDKGDILEHYRYTAFGEVTIYDENGNVETESQIDNSILWKRLDPVSGFYFYKYRYYSAELGRWPSRDPIEELGGLNLYGFVGNDPIGKWDLLGNATIGSCNNKSDLGNIEIIDVIIEIDTYDDSLLKRRKVVLDTPSLSLYKPDVEVEYKKCVCSFFGGVTWDEREAEADVWDYTTTAIYFSLSYEDAQAFAMEMYVGLLGTL